MIIFERKFFVIAGILTIVQLGAKDNWDFRMSDLVKNPDGTDI